MPPSPSSLSPLPLFPLGSVLFPDGYLPLRIFEVRYLDLIGKCHKSGAPFGVVSLTEGAEVRVAGAGTERFAPVGTLATIRRFESPQPGLIQIECIGTQRFEVRSSELQKHGLWTAVVEIVPDDMPLAIPADLQHAADALRRLVDTLEERQRMEQQDDLQLPFVEPYRFDDCGWVANRWAELLPMQTTLKQRLMVLDSPLMRLELVGDLLARNGIAG
ncbi:LON peptidase substrate-binding domain-containing protein [Variovorax guangxiensis]|uniref:Peptidase S16 n=1 Tax=Variovorax guangxiensis TaxID=1775474 RepID=A0A502DK94_9BURK|nr:LON peptidase substrate-binding domain-containing protein [Variovorax guangxiensis]RZI67429.1 MAG: peptidase S16 [Variovorax sp.]TPG21977.1 peptidase S16 [Variovorax ginsengisoli]TPG25865.1 peptidase S16 [Variovorax guangxiensis]